MLSHCMVSHCPAFCPMSGHLQLVTPAKGLARMFNRVGASRPFHTKPADTDTLSPLGQILDVLTTTCMCVMYHTNICTPLPAADLPH
jgi:hypothetical protein